MISPGVCSQARSGAWETCISTRAIGVPDAPDDMQAPARTPSMEWRCRVLYVAELRQVLVGIVGIESDWSGSCIDGIRPGKAEYVTSCSPDCREPSEITSHTETVVHIQTRRNVCASVCREAGRQIGPLVD
jgi:hypothetical protein